VNIENFFALSLHDSFTAYQGYSVFFKDDYLQKQLVNTFFNHLGNVVFFYIFDIVHLKFYIMKVLVDIPDNKADFGLEVLRNLMFVKKANPISSQKYLLMEEIKEAVEELNLIKTGKKTARNAEDFLNEL
jgi:hypothetical protein